MHLDCFTWGPRGQRTGGWGEERKASESPRSLAGHKPQLSPSRGDSLILKARRKQRAVPHRLVCSSRTAGLSVQGSGSTCVS